MFSLAFDFFRWMFRRFVWFLLIIVVLWAGYTIKAQLKGLADLEATVQYLKGGKSRLEAEAKLLSDKTKKSAADLQNAAVSQLEERIRQLERELDVKNQRLAELDGLLALLNPAKQIDVARLKIEIDIASQELEHLRYLKALRVQHIGIADLTQQCNGIRDRHIAELKAYWAVQTQIQAMGNVWNPLSDDYQQLKTLEARRDQRVANTHTLKAQHDQCMINLARVKRAAKVAQDFVVKGEMTLAAMAELQSHVVAMEEKVAKHWLKPILIDPMVQLMPLALCILAGAVVVPIGIKLVLYFVLAPLAAKQSSICLQPDEGKSESTRQPESPSEVSLSLEIAPDSELVVLPAYFRVVPDYCTTRIRWVLNDHFVLTSLAAGMYNMTEVRGDQVFSAKVSVGHELFGELQKFEIGKGESVCLRPSNLVGIVQMRNAPVRVTSHWRLGSLQAWLTFQLRYLVFHGPATLIIKGGRGVRIESASESRAIEQTSTLGFSGHLNYSTTRSETFMAYFGGHKGLLRDRFSGRSGYFIYEEMADPTKKAGLTGKAGGWVFDTAMKAFGI